MSYRADLEALAGLVEQMVGFDAHARELADQLWSEQQALAAGWTGAASDRADAAHRRWAGGHEQVQDVLGSLAGFVRTAHANYTTAAETNSRMWR